MEFAGDEKRVQALFSEQLLEDQCVAPGFESVWMNAEKVGPARRASHKSLVAIFAAFIIAAAALVAVRSWRRSTPSTNQALNVSPQMIVTPGPETVRQTNRDTALTRGLKPRHERQKRLFRPRPLERNTAHEAALISTWQSPTRLFMNSPVALSFNSLPQLTQSAEDLKQFLSRETDLTKESNQ